MASLEGLKGKKTKFSQLPGLRLKQELLSAAALTASDGQGLKPTSVRASGWEPREPNESRLAEGLS